MTDIVQIPETLPIAPFPALGSANYNQEAYDNGTTVPPAIERAREIVLAGHTNAVAAKESAETASLAASSTAGSVEAASSAKTAAEDAAAQAAESQQAALAAKELAVPAAQQALAAAQRAEEAAASIQDGPVTRVNGKTGDVTLSAVDVGAVAESTFLARMHAAALSF